MAWISLDFVLNKKTTVNDLYKQILKKIFKPSYLAALFARALTGMNVRDMITSIGSAAAAAPAAGAGAATDAAPAGTYKYSRTWVLTPPL